MSDEDGRSPEIRRRRSGAGTEAARDAAGAEDTARRKPRSLPCTKGGLRKEYANRSLRLLAGKVVELRDKPRNGEAGAKKKASPAKGKSSTG